MTFVVTEACIQCKYTDCVEVCPMDCFRQGPNFVVIDPDECIDCSMCVAECPVGAIVGEAEISQDQRVFIGINAQLAKESGWPRLTTSQAPLPEHQAWAQVTQKRHLLQR